MCTLIALYRCIEGASLVVAANRDEALDRPAQPPALRSLSWGTALAPRDLRAGGTWLALGQGPLFAAVTNRPCPDPDPRRRSRGLLVHDALEAGSAARAADRLSRLPEGAYNPFNLLVADEEQASVVSYHERPVRIDLDPGLHVIGNADPRHPTPKVRRIAARARQLAGLGGEELFEGLAGLCRHHEPLEDALAATCVHTEHYGTRSSTLLRLASDPSESALRYSDGAPCRTAYQDFSPLLRALAGGCRPLEGVQVARSSR